MIPSYSSHTHCQIAQADPQTKTWQRVCLLHHTDRKRNNEGTTLAIRNTGFGGKLKLKTFNKLIGKRKVKCLEIPHYA